MSHVSLTAACDLGAEAAYTSRWRAGQSTRGSEALLGAGALACGPSKSEPSAAVGASALSASTSSLAALSPPSVVAAATTGTPPLLLPPCPSASSSAGVTAVSAALSLHELPR